jgi:hypothetical protein
MRSLALLLLSLAPSLTMAQQVTGSIAGTITDPGGAAVAGAAVQLVSAETRAIRNATADSAGSFVFTAVTPGIFNVSVEHPGFKKYEKQGIELPPGETISLGNLRLDVGSISESVTVKAEGSTLQLNNGERAGTITSEEIKDLTIMNRDFTQFAELMPGVVANVTQEVQTFSGNTTFNVAGGRTTGNNILIDGMPSGNSNQSNMNTTLSLDAVQTVEVKLSNFDAEYGRSQGMTIMAVSKGGTSQYHGTAYYYIRNEAFNANNFFNNQKGIPQTPYRISTMGGNINGPLSIPRMPSLKNKLFFLWSSEEIREKRPKGEVDLTVPTALERQGNFTQSVVSGKAVVVKDPLTGAAFSGNVIPADRILKSTQNYLNLLPLPNFTSAANQLIAKGQYNYVFQESLNVPKRIETGRIDYNISEKTMMYFRANYWWEDQSGNAVSAANTSWGWLPQHYTAISPSYVSSVTHIINPTTVLQGSIGYARFTEDGSPLHPADVAAKTRAATGVNIPQFHPENNPFNLVPGASFGGIANAANPGYTARYPLRGVENTYNANGTLNKTIGGHAIKAGIYAEHWQAMKGLNAANFAGTMAFATDSNNAQDTSNAYSNALLGVLNSYTEATSRPPMYEFTTSVEWFAQDNWKVKRNLTLNLGVRFGWALPWHSEQLQEAGFVPSLWNPANAVQLIRPVLVGTTRMGMNPITGAILPAVTIGAIAPEAGNPINGIVYRKTSPDYPAGLRNTDGIKTAPRLGFAWDPLGNGKTVIRGGGGVFYNMHDQDNFGNNIEYTPPIQYQPAINYTTVQTFINQSGLNSPGTIQGFDVNQHIQKTYNFSFGVQRDIGFGNVLDVAYVGSLARHLEERVNLNSTQLGTNFQPASIDPTTKKPYASQFLRPYQGYADINYYFFGGNSSYHSLQATLRRRYKNGLTYGFVYTYSKAMNYADSEGSSTATTVSNLINPKVWNYGEAGFDHTQIFRFYWNYNLPRASTLINSRIVKAAFDNLQLSGIYTFQSGAPMGVSYSYSPSQDITGSTDSGRVNIVGDPNAGPLTHLQAFNTAAVAPPSPTGCQVPNTPFACWGNANKDVFHGAPINNLDVSMFKNIPIRGERLRAQFRVEAYNVLNHTQFTTVNTAAQFNPTTGAQTNALFGQYTATAAPRRLQLALRVSF